MVSDSDSGVSGTVAGVCGELTSFTCNKHLYVLSHSFVSLTYLQISNECNQFEDVFAVAQLLYQRILYEPCESVQDGSAVNVCKGVGFALRAGFSLSSILWSIVPTRFRSTASGRRTIVSWNIPDIPYGTATSYCSTF